MAEHEEANGNADIISALERKIIKQVEFYFGDKNLPRDKFLRQKVEEDDGWVTFECLVTFNRLQALTKDIDVIAKALRKSDGDIIEVSEDNKKVRRLKSKPLPENTTEARQLSKSKTVYCKGFPKETTLDQLEEFFADKGKVIFILMRRTVDHTFKGSVFVEFANVEDVTTFLALEPEKVKFNEEEILRMTREDYYKKKEAERVQFKEDQKKEAQKKESEKKREKEEIKAEKKDEEKEETIKYESGCVLHFKSVGEQTSREDLKSLFGEHEDISWVNFTRGDTEGYVRFSKEGGAIRVIKALQETGDGKVVIRDVETTLRVLEGKEETDYWRKVQEDKMKNRQKKAWRQGHRFGGGRGRDKRKANRRSEGENAATDDTQEPQGSHVRFDDGEPSPKKVKTEDS